jgi:TPR repeat protein
MNRLILLVFLGLAVPADADVLILKGGQRFEGDVVDNGKTYEIKAGTSVISIAKTEVLRHILSIDALTAEAEKLHAEARELYGQATKPDSDLKLANEQLKKGVELLRKAADLYQEAREVYPEEKQSFFDDATVKLIQEMRLYRDKMSSELAKSIEPAPAPPDSKAAATPAPEAKPAAPAPPATPPPAKPVKRDLIELLPLAKSGDLDAMYSAGLILEVEDWKATEATRWFRAAADKGHGKSLVHLGILALEGRGRKPDPKEALSWLQKAEAKNEPLAKVYLARMWSDGVGGPRNLHRADELCERAMPNLLKDAPYGDPEVLSALGWMYLEGLGTAKNGEKALEFLGSAADQGDVRALTTIGMMYDQGHGTAASFADAEKAYRTAAEKGFAPAQEAFAEIHDSNFWRKNNPHMDRKLAREWFLKSANQGYPLGQFWMAWFNIRGHEGPKDEKEGFRLWTEALKGANTKLRTMILNDYGYCCEHGMGTKKDVREAAKYWKESADLGSAMSQYNMGWYNDTELRNVTEAFKYFDLAARQNYPHATFKLGQFYREGRGVAKNLQESERWYAVAAQLNFTGASEKLKEVQAERAAAKR